MVRFIYHTQSKQDQKKERGMKIAVVIFTSRIVREGRKQRIAEQIENWC